MITHYCSVISLVSFQAVCAYSNCCCLHMNCTQLYSSNHHDIDVIYLDYYKVFHSVSHNELLLKLWKYGITGDLRLWFKAYLMACSYAASMCKNVTRHLKECLPVISGVPQGSLLHGAFTSYILMTCSTYSLWLYMSRPFIISYLCWC